MSECLSFVSKDFMMKHNLELVSAVDQIVAKVNKIYVYWEY